MARISRDQLLKLQRRYRTDAAIGNLYGISRQAVYKLRKRYGIPPVSDRTEHRNTEIANRYLQGRSAPRIARRFRLSTVHVYRILRSMHVPLRRGGRSPDSTGSAGTAS